MVMPICQQQFVDRHAGNTQVYQEVLQIIETLSSTVTQGLLNAVEYIAEHYGVFEADTDVRHQLDQRPIQGHSIGSLMPSAAATATNFRTNATASSMPAAASSHQQQQSCAAAAGVLQPLLGLCKLLHAYQLPPDISEAALQLLQVNPSIVWDTCTQLAHHNLMELTAQLDEAENAMLAPLHWPGSGSHTIPQSAANHQDKPDQQQLVIASNYGFGSTVSKYQLPWSSGLGPQTSAEGVQELGVSPPPEVRVKMRLKAHLALHVQTAQALQRAHTAQQELDGILASTPLLLPVLEVGIGSGSTLTWQAELAQLYMHAAQERAKVQLLQQYEQQFNQELEELLEIKERTEEKVLLVRNQVRAAAGVLLVTTRVWRYSDMGKSAGPADFCKSSSVLGWLWAIDVLGCGFGLTSKHSTACADPRLTSKTDFLGDMTVAYTVSFLVA